MKCTNYIVFLFGVFLPSISSRCVEFYRKDYTYIKEFDAFYKVHWDLKEMSWNMASLLCDEEGATLFYPKHKNEWALVKNLTNNISTVPDTDVIFVGLNEDFISGKYTTVDSLSRIYNSDLYGDELLIPGEDNCLYMYMNRGSFGVNPCLQTVHSAIPFLCKREDNKSCPTIDRDYEYSDDLRKCYKINKKPKTWLQAMMTCSMEGGVLAVIESGEDVNAIKNKAEVGQTYFVGFRKIFSHNIFYTVKGQKIDQDDRIYDAYRNSYNVAPGECGAVYYADYSFCSTTADCDNTLPFICEMETIV